MTQAFTTLLAHAVHFAPDASTVNVDIDVGTGAARVAVHDEGAPAAASALPYLFDRNRPQDAARNSPRGSFRLGLGFVRDVITYHGGWIEAESAGNRHGMTFRVAVPVQSGTPDAVAPSPPYAVEHPRSLGALRVLLVDDEPDAREALMGILQHYGARVRVAGSAADAIVALQHEPVDVLLADIGMPGADGYDLIRYVRSLESEEAARVPAVAVTAFASEADRRRALDAGFQMHLSKPVDPGALVAAVAALARPTSSVR
jgi:CheY-like chemotaxis protein